MFAAQRRARPRPYCAWRPRPQGVLVCLLMPVPRDFVPQPRRRGIVSQEVDDETLLYVEETHQASALNGPASRIWALCDGKRPVEVIAEETGFVADQVLVTLKEFSDAGLLENGAQLPARPNMARRRLMAGAALAAIPVIMLVTATAPRAQACASASQPCTFTPDCCPGLSCSTITHTCG